MIDLLHHLQIDPRLAADQHQLRRAADLIKGAVKRRQRAANLAYRRCSDLLLAAVRRPSTAFPDGCLAG
jgi:hypothetical protein